MASMRYQVELASILEQEAAEAIYGLYPDRLDMSFEECLKRASHNQIQVHEKAKSLHRLLVHLAIDGGYAVWDGKTNTLKWTNKRRARRSALRGQAE